MKRNMDIIRRIALETEQLEYGYRITGIDGITPQELGVHVIWMKEAGLLDAHVSEYADAADCAPLVQIVRLTWSGCEFVDAARSDTLWAKAKQSVIKPAASFSFQLLREWLLAEAKQGFPTLRT